MQQSKGETAKWRSMISGTWKAWQGDHEVVLFFLVPVLVMEKEKEQVSTCERVYPYNTAVMISKAVRLLWT